MNGLAGALIIEEPEDQKIPVDKDLIWIIQESVGEKADRVYASLRDPDVLTTQPFGATDPVVTFTVNALHAPVLEIRPNEIHRWRVINATATPRGLMYLALVDERGAVVPDALALIAVDGITLYGQSPKPVMAPGHFMAPGNRADFLVKLPVPGTYTVVKRKMSLTGGDQGPQPVPNEEILVRIIVLRSPVMPAREFPRLPSKDKAPWYLKPITDEEVKDHPVRTFHFGVNKPGRFGGFTINGAAYGRQGSDGNSLTPLNTKVRLGTAEEWILTNSSSAAHVFHLSFNLFQVVEVEDPSSGHLSTRFDPEDALWRDTVTILPATESGTPEARPSRVRIRTRFFSGPGTSVLQCHILVHGDAGMRQRVTVRDTGHGMGKPEAEAVQEED